LKIRTNGITSELAEVTKDTFTPKLSRSLTLIRSIAFVQNPANIIPNGSYRNKEQILRPTSNVQRAAQPPHNNISLTKPSPKSSSTARKSTKSATNDYTSNLEWELIIVDDGSPDGTQEVAQQLQRVYSPSRIQIRARAGKLGLGTAYVH
jgi:dolichol-phosphate mannosyltransferase